MQLSDLMSGETCFGCDGIGWGHHCDGKALCHECRGTGKHLTEMGRDLADFIVLVMDSQMVEVEECN